MTHNQKLLAQMMATYAVQRASRAHLPQSGDRVMDALKEAIESKRDEIQGMLVAGKLDTGAYHDAKAQLAKWTDAWNSNR